jgi:hypothetical protein
VTDLFGAPMTDADFARKPKPALARILGPLHYRKAETREQRCATCAHHMINCHARNYHKCDLAGSSNSPATDIRAGWVCDAWRAEA